jgi:ADP-heptose:LPS heptosyltransferase
VNKPIILLLRSFGDFVIAIAVLRRSSLADSYRLIASIHLEPLYRSMQEVSPDLNLHISFVNIGIKHKILGLFTYRHFFDPHSVKELLQLNHLLKVQRGNQEIYFEQKKRLWLINFFTRKKSYPIHTKGNVYQSYCDRFNVVAEDMILKTDRSDHQKILILPESRLPRKEIPQGKVIDLIHSHIEKKQEVTTAFFQKQPYSVPGKAAVHLYFSELIKLIMEADFIITADSLPAHLAQFLNKPHHICYRNSPSYSWMTPFVSHFQQYSTFG